MDAVTMAAPPSSSSVGSDSMSLQPARDRLRHEEHRRQAGQADGQTGAPHERDDGAATATITPMTMPTSVRPANTSACAQPIAVTPAAA